jgi:hypothetical protein
MVMSHFPLFHSKTAAHANMSAAHYVGDERMGEYAVDGTKMKFEPCTSAACQTVGEFQSQVGSSLQGFFHKYVLHHVFNISHELCHHTDDITLC